MIGKNSKHVKKFLESHIKNNEKIVTYCDGYIGEMMGSGDDKQHNGVLIVTNERIIFYRKGILGEILETMPLNKITSIEKKSLLGHFTIKIHTSHDKLSFKTLKKDSVKPFLEAIENGRDSFLNNSQNVSSSMNSDPVEAIKKLSELKDLGILTQEEFDHKKASLLQNI